MTTLLIIAVIVIALVIWKYFSGKSKNHSEKSGMEKISATVINGVKRDIDNVAEGMRGIRTVKNELMQEINNSLRDLKSDYTIYFESLITARETYQKIYKTSLEVVEKLEKEAKENKQRYLEIQEESYKEEACKKVAYLIEAKEMVRKSKDNYSKMVKRIEEGRNDYAFAVMKLEEKRAEVSALNCNINLSTKEVNNLIEELKGKMRKDEAVNETNSIINESSSENPPVKASPKEIETLYDIL